MTPEEAIEILKGNSPTPPYGYSVVIWEAQSKALIELIKHLSQENEQLKTEVDSLNEKLDKLADTLPCDLDELLEE